MTDPQYIEPAGRNSAVFSLALALVDAGDQLKN